MHRQTVFISAITEAESAYSVTPIISILQIAHPIQIPMDSERMDRVLLSGSAGHGLAATTDLTVLHQKVQILLNTAGLLI